MYNQFVLMLLLLVYPNKMNDPFLFVVVVVVVVVYYTMMLYFDKLHNQDFYLLFVYNIYELQFLILVDRYNYLYNMMIDFVYLNDYVDELFHSIDDIHQ